MYESEHVHTVPMHPRFDFEAFDDWIERTLELNEEVIPALGGAATRQDNFGISSKESDAPALTA